VFTDDYIFYLMVTLSNIATSREFVKYKIFRNCHAWNSMTSV